MELVVDPHGSVHCLYSEELDLHVLGQLAISRASYVEPDADGRWVADLSPVRGPYLGPFESRGQALDAEVQWLKQHWLIQAR